MSSHAAAIRSLSEQQHATFLDFRGSLFIFPVLDILEVKALLAARTESYYRTQ